MIQVTFLGVTKKESMCKAAKTVQEKPNMKWECLEAAHFKPEVIETFPYEQLSHAVLAWLKEDPERCDVIHGHEWGGVFIDIVTMTYLRQVSKNSSHFAFHSLYINTECAQRASILLNSFIFAKSVDQDICRLQERKQVTANFENKSRWHRNFQPTGTSILHWCLSTLHQLFINVTTSRDEQLEVIWLESPCCCPLFILVTAICTMNIILRKVFDCPIPICSQ